MEHLGTLDDHGLLAEKRPLDRSRLVCPVEDGQPLEEEGESRGCEDEEE